MIVTKKIMRLNGFMVLYAICNLQSFSQNIEFKASNFKDKKEEFKEAVTNIKAGDELLEIANEAVAVVKNPGDMFIKALSHYLKADNFNPNSAELNMKIGNCYLYTNENTKQKRLWIKHLN